MITPVIMDSSAMIAIALREKRGEQARQIIRSAPGSCFIHAVNAFEVVAVLMRRGLREADAQRAVTFGGVILVEETPEKLIYHAARIKDAHSDLSLGDCHCLAFAEEMKGYLLTTEEELTKALTTIKVIRLL